MIKKKGPWFPIIYGIIKIEDIRFQNSLHIPPPLQYPPELALLNLRFLQFPVEIIYMKIYYYPE